MSRLIVWIGMLFATMMAMTAHAESPTLARIPSEGVLRVAMADSPPAQSKNPATGQWEGYNVDMANELANVLGVELELVDATWATLIPGLMTEKYDIAMVDMFATPERARTVLFTVPYIKLGYSFVVRADSPIQDWHDLNDPQYTLVQVPGTSALPFIEQNLPNAQVRLLASDNVNAPRLEVANGRADAHLTDHINQVIFVEANPDANLRIIPDASQELLNATGISYAVRPDDFHFWAFLNTWINSTVDSGLAAELRMKHYHF